MVKMAQVYAEMAKPAGFDINVIVTPADSYWDNIWLKKPFLTSAWSMRPPGEGLAVAYTAERQVNETHWKRPDYDAMLLKANTDGRSGRAHQALSADGRSCSPRRAARSFRCSSTRCWRCARAAVATRRGLQNFNLNYEDLSCAK